MKIQLPSFLTMLGLISVALKVFGVVSWSWWVVLIPFYPMALGAIIAIPIILFALAVAAIAAKD